MKPFAFYGRVSTEDLQDPASSRAWQLRRALELIEAAGGEVVAEFFDVGQSRSLPWKRRVEASRLLELLRSPDRAFEAVVIGEPQRAFYGAQFALTFPLFEHYGVELWVPEVGGRVDPGSEAHDMVMTLFGGMSKGERSRIRTRVRNAMAAQAATQGRFLGGRPPYGYRFRGCPGAVTPRWWHTPHRRRRRRTLATATKGAARAVFGRQAYVDGLGVLDPGHTACARAPRLLLGAQRHVQAGFLSSVRVEDDAPDRASRADGRRPANGLRTEASKRARRLAAGLDFADNVIALKLERIHTAPSADGLAESCPY